MKTILKEKIIEVCKQKIQQKGEDVGLAFYSFFANNNDDPQLILDMAKWWVNESKLEHIEKAIKIKKMIELL